jgi:hypothetical protein
VLNDYPNYVVHDKGQLLTEHSGRPLKAEGRAEAMRYMSYIPVRPRSDVDIGDNGIKLD